MREGAYRLADVNLAVGGVGGLVDNAFHVKKNPRAFVRQYQYRITRPGLCISLWPPGTRLCLVAGGGIEPPTFWL